VYFLQSQPRAAVVVALASDHRTARLAALAAAVVAASAQLVARERQAAITVAAAQVMAVAEAEARARLAAMLLPQLAALAVSVQHRRWLRQQALGRT
jgi:hypothetical protein